MLMTKIEYDEGNLVSDVTPTSLVQAVKSELGLKQTCAYYSKQVTNYSYFNQIFNWSQLQLLPHLSN